MGVFQDVIDNADTDIENKQAQIDAMETNKELATDRYNAGVDVLEQLYNELFDDSTGYVSIELLDLGIIDYWKFEYNYMYSGTGEGSSELNTTLNEWQIFEDVTITDGGEILPTYVDTTTVTFEGDQTSNSQLANGLVYYFKGSSPTYPIPKGTISNSSYELLDDLTTVTFTMSVSVIPTDLEKFTDLVMDPQSSDPEIWDSTSTNIIEIENRFDEFDFMIDYIHQDLGTDGTYGLKANKNIWDTGTSMLQADQAMLETAKTKLLRFA